MITIVSKLFIQIPELVCISGTSISRSNGTLCIINDDYEYEIFNDKKINYDRIYMSSIDLFKLKCDVFGFGTQILWENTNDNCTNNHENLFDKNQNEFIINENIHQFMNFINCASNLIKKLNIRKSYCT